MLGNGPRGCLGGDTGRDWDPMTGHGHCRVVLLLLLLCILQVAEALLGDCPGCQRPAPPKCCPPTCPRCLPLSKRHDPALFSDARSASLPVSIARPKRMRRSSRMEKNGRVGGGLPSRIPLLDEQDFYRIDDWAVPREECEGPDCACANCVCCFTETVLLATTTTCTATVTSTTITTSTFTSTFLQSDFVTLTNKIKFIVTNNLQFISTLSRTATATQAILLTFSRLTTVTSITKMYLSMTTELGAVGTVYSSLSGGPTVTLFTGETTVQSSVALSVYEPYIIEVTSLVPTLSISSLRTIPLFGCYRPVTFSPNGTLTLTSTRTPPATLLLTPQATFIDASTRVQSTNTLTETLTRCLEEPVTTVKYTPTRTIVAETVTPSCSMAPGDLGCPVCVVAI